MKELEGHVHIDPTNMRIRVDGYGDITEDVARELAELRKQDVERVAQLAARRQAHIARQAEATHLKFGALVAQVDEGVYQHYIDRYGPKFWREKGNMKWFLNRHPECRARSTAKSTTVRVPGYVVNDRRAARAEVTA